MTREARPTESSRPKLSDPQRRVLLESDKGRVTADPRTITKLRRMGLVGRKIESFALKEQAPHGRWFNRQFEAAELTTSGLREQHCLRHACCHRAAPTNCVCLASFECSKHGRTHVGTHD